MKDFGHTPNPDAAAHREMSHEAIRNVVDLWSMAVLGSKVEREVSSESSLLEMMQQTLSEQTLALAESWGLQPDPEVIEEIRQEQDPQLKAQLQETYIRSLGAEIQSVVRSFDQSPPRSSKWDSWPQRMKERKRFNCVGAIQLGSALLKEAGIETSIGNPASHVVNIARLANGDWWYVDLMNGGNQIRPINPTEIQLGSRVCTARQAAPKELALLAPFPVASHGVCTLVCFASLGNVQASLSHSARFVSQSASVLRLTEPEIDYRLVPLYSTDEMPVFVLGNLASLQRDAQEEDVDDEILAAREYANRFRDTLQRVDLSELTDRLYPHAHDVQKTDEMREETERINRLYSDDLSIKEVIAPLSQAELLELVADLKVQIEPVRAYLLEDGELPAELEDPARTFLITYRDSLRRVAQGNEEEYRRLVEGRLAKILGVKT